MPKVRLDWLNVDLMVCYTNCKPFQFPMTVHPFTFLSLPIYPLSSTGFFDLTVIANSGEETSNSKEEVNPFPMLTLAI